MNEQVPEARTDLWGQPIEVDPYAEGEIEPAVVDPAEAELDDMVTAQRPPAKSNGRLANLWKGMPDLSRGACNQTGASLELFFPDSSLVREEREGLTMRALALCVKCPVRLPCLDYAEKTGQEGTWGGLDYDDRKRLKDPFDFLDLSLRGAKIELAEYRARQKEVVQSGDAATS